MSSRFPQTLRWNWASKILWYLNKKAWILKHEDVLFVVYIYSQYRQFTEILSMSLILNPRSFIPSNSAGKISCNDGYLNIVSPIGFMLFKELVMLVVQLVAWNNLSFVSTIFSKKPLNIKVQITWHYLFELQATKTASRSGGIFSGSIPCLE